jgi:tRNA threonylcarbamoyladenosine modification (KEOPS) complex Cgi121 subunit
MLNEAVYIGIALLVVSLTLGVWTRIEVRTIRREVSQTISCQASRIQALRYAAKAALKALDDKSNTAKDHARSILYAAVEADRRTDDG